MMSEIALPMGALRERLRAIDPTGVFRLLLWLHEEGAIDLGAPGMIERIDSFLYPHDAPA